MWQSYVPLPFAQLGRTGVPRNDLRRTASVGRQDVAGEALAMTTLIAPAVKGTAHSEGRAAHNFSCCPPPRPRHIDQQSPALRVDGGPSTDFSLKARVSDAESEAQNKC